MVKQGLPDGIHGAYQTVRKKTFLFSWICRTNFIQTIKCICTWNRLQDCIFKRIDLKRKSRCSNALIGIETEFNCKLIFDQVF